MSKKFFLFLAWGLLVLSTLGATAPFDGFRHPSFFFIPLIAIISIEFYKNTLRPAVSLLLVAFTVGTLAEAHGLAYGTIFGARYEYAFQSITSLANVPLQVGAFWAIFYYLSHVVVNTFNRSGSLLRLCLLDAALMTGIDLLLDPVMVAQGAWRWFGTGPYFGIPTGNFFGWFFVSLTISLVVRKFLKIKIFDRAHFALVSLAIIVVLLSFDLARGS